MFLRELLSNASDALDKERFLALTSPAESAEALRIRLIPDEANQNLTIDDNGVGMDEAELIKNLGTIAHSGSNEFLKQVAEKKDVNLIGQFGVGFYSAYLVADRVTVISRKRGESLACRWESDAKQGFTIDQGERDGRGTSVILHLKDEHKEFLNPGRIRQLVARYSDYVGYPIELGVNKDGELDFDRRQPGIGTLAAQAERDHRRAVRRVLPAPHPRLGTRARAQALPRGGQPGVYRSAFHPEAPALRSVLARGAARCTPAREARVHHGRLQGAACRVGLRFVRGVIDSEDLPLNVSREILQDSKLVRIIRKQVIKQVLDLLDEIADKRPEDYALLFKNYGTVLKEGVHLDPEYKDRLAKLLRFESSKAETTTSLADYVQRMPEAQNVDLLPAWPIAPHGGVQPAHRVAARPWLRDPVHDRSGRRVGGARPRRVRGQATALCDG